MRTRDHEATTVAAELVEGLGQLQKTLAQWRLAGEVFDAGSVTAVDAASTIDDER